MGLGATNVSLSDIRNQTGAFFGADDSFFDYNASSWAQGPPPGNNTEIIWGSGTRTAVAENILFNPSNNGAGAGVTTNYKFGFYKNYFGYMDQSTYIIEVYVENNIPPAPRGFPFNDVSFTAALKDDTLTSNDIAPMGATNVPQNGGTFGPGDQSQPATFNVEYFYIEGNYFNQGPDNYNVDLYVNAGLEYSAAGVPGNAAAQFFDYTSFNTPNAQNNGSGFSLEVYFS
jgi:hypothetical protein